MFGGYRQGKQELPRVIHASVARYRESLPVAGEPLEFLVSLHEEGTGFTWQQNALVDPATEQSLLETTRELYFWSLGLALTPDLVRQRLDRLGVLLHDSFIGDHGEAYLQRLTPTAVLLDVDETILNLPWELMTWSGSPLAQQYPLGRLVTSRFLPRPPRDPLSEDATLRILAVANPTADLSDAEAEVETIESLEGNHAGFQVKVTVLKRNRATKAHFIQAIEKEDYDILHFAGHAALDPEQPEISALQLADGPLTADEVLALPWKAPPYLVFNSACETGRAAGGKRLVSAEGGHSNGLAAAFLAAGVYGYAGYFWPVTTSGARLFAETFYRALFERENVGIAFLAAREETTRSLGENGDLTGHSAVLFGDAASSHRRDLATAS
jgi:CHAT domain-containing protein